MTPLEAKNRYGREDGYVSCYSCPAKEKELCHIASPTGYQDCWNVIARLESNPYWERICKLSEKQREKGMKTYGQGIESNPAAIMARLEHLEEELVDSLYYIEWIKDKLVEIEGGNHD